MNSATVVPTGHEAVVKDARKKRLTTTKMDSPVWYLLKASVIYVLVLSDVYINSAVNSSSFSGAVGMQLGSFWPFLFLVYVSASSPRASASVRPCAHPATVISLL